MPEAWFGDYRLVRELGRGAMGVVHEAHHERLGRRLALKVMSAHLGTDPEYRERFAREAAALARVDSPHIVQVVDHGERDGALFLAMQYVDGGDLETRLQQHGPLAPVDALKVAADVAAGLADAHRVGVLHRDVKTRNVLLRADTSREPHAYLCDFGIADAGLGELTGTGLVNGTPAYLAPERFRSEPADERADVYAVGCLLWACLTGRPPYDGGLSQQLYGHNTLPVPQLVGAPPREVAVNAVLARAMAKDPRHRYATAVDLRRDLQSAARLAESPVTQAALAAPPRPAPTYDTPVQPPPQPQPPAPATERRSRLPLVVAAVVVLGLGVGAAVAATGVLGSDDPPADRSAATTDPASSATPTPSEVTPPVAATTTAGTPTAAPRTADPIVADGLPVTTLDPATGDLVVVDLGLDRVSSGAGSPADLLGPVDGLLAADVDGDGVRETLVVSDGTVEVLGRPGAIATLPAVRQELAVGDVDGDRDDDLVSVTCRDGATDSQQLDCVDGVDVHAWLADDGALVDAGEWAHHPGWRLDMRVALADVDADRDADLVNLGVPAKGKRGVDLQVWRSSGTGFDQPGQWAVRERVFLSDVDLVLADVNGTGRASALLGVAGSWTAYAADTDGFRSGIPITSPLDSRLPLPADVNRDGIVELVWPSTDGRAVTVGTGPTSDLDTAGTLTWPTRSLTLS